MPELLSKEEAERLISKYTNTVYRLALSYTAKRADAEDVMQDVFLRYIRSGIVFESEEHEKAWFLRVTANCCKSLLMSTWRKRHALVGSIEQSQVEAEPMEKHPVTAAVAQLPKKQRACIHLFYYEDMPIRNIAMTLGMNESTVRSNLVRARKNLSRMMEDNKNV